MLEDSIQPVPCGVCVRGCKGCVRATTLEPRRVARLLPRFYGETTRLFFLYSSCLLLLLVPLSGPDLQVQKRPLSSILVAPVCCTMTLLPDDLQHRYGRIYELCLLALGCARTALLSCHHFAPSLVPSHTSFFVHAFFALTLRKENWYRLNLSLGLASPISYASALY